MVKNRFQVKNKRFAFLGWENLRELQVIKCVLKRDFIFFGKKQIPGKKNKRFGFLEWENLCELQVIKCVFKD